MQKNVRGGKYNEIGSSRESNKIGEKKITEDSKFVARTHWR